MFLFWFRAAHMLMVGELPLQTCIMISFQFTILCMLTHIPTGHIQTLHVLNSCSTIEDIAFLVRAAWEIWLESYDARHASQLTSDITLCVYCVHKGKNKGNLNSTTFQLTPLLPQMILLVLKVARESQPVSYGPIHTSLYSYLLQNYEWQQKSLSLCLYCNTDSS